ncbi:gliding motility lipoprotein GldH [Flavobacterium columnare NBRC 100251 = ATCC 23463]|uniref:Gliding motility protein GldH n=2 Tax=Flavobacterium columnare TaxID=996 RepID=G8X8Q9_FLACA|nr:gliding motility lipoprotein GldH [Flavobacterium columnare]AEW86510.1 gliding motility protein GldH [Flavobacterium columnare ATCC 49512]AMO21474.2 gliding motility lipoprotein GldH [Flavobacterium columnare]ANO49691.1 gliding motility protein GldH [Flavobacterium columnare]APT22376.1 gliding motility lipoprotein GldH [Flavobacterium columnare]AUX18388.1 gliding motility lipoprotein GldH [Flavobacterium columnare]
MIKEIIKTNWYGFLLGITLVSCDKSQVFDQYKTFENGWPKKEAVSFEFEQNASQKPLNLFINVRNNDDYEFSNLFLIVKLEQPKGKIYIDTLEYQMANPDGSLMGQGFSDVKESKLWYKENYIFPKTGKYKVTIQQAVRENGKLKGIEVLNGVTELGFRIESIEENK